MKRRQQAALFGANFGSYIIGNSVLPLLPVYAARLGADVSSAGLTMGLALGSLATGTMLAGRISARYGRRRHMIVLTAVITMPALFLMGRVTSPLSLAALMSLIWFLGGFNMTSVNILTGLFARRAERGKAFGIIGVAPGLAQIIGGLTAGLVAERLGFETLFTLLAATQVLPLIAGLVVEDAALTPRERAARRGPVALGESFGLLLLAAGLMGMVSSTSGLGRSVAMADLDFSPSAISSANVIAGLIATPMPFLIGWLSDRFDRRWLLALCYALVMAGSLVFAGATALGHFWLGTALFALMPASSSLSSALTADLVPRAALDTALSRLAATPWIAGVIGFIGGGYVIRALGVDAIFAVGVVVPAVAALLLYLAHQPALPLATETSEHPAASA